MLERKDWVVILYTEADCIGGSATIVSRLLRIGYLWDRVRVMGGAYGGFCTFSSFSGLIVIQI
jgi:presequence protease